MMKTVDLQPNHRRSFSSTLYLLEKMTAEIREVLTSEKQWYMQKVEKDLSEEKKEEVFQVLTLLEDEIGRLAEKYRLSPQEMVESHFLNSRKSKAWEILNDSLSKRMNGFGKFPPELAREYDADIEKLLKLVSRL
jgi:hypothetical protein